jgi:hypothetical protein
MFARYYILDNIYLITGRIVCEAQRYTKIIARGSCWERGRVEISSWKREGRGYM